MLQSIILGGIMIALSAMDLWKKKLPAWILYALLGVSVCVRLSMHTGILPFVYAITPGAVMLALAKLTREQIGYGDGLLLVSLGLFLGCEKTIFIVCGAMLVSFLVSVMILLLKKGNKKTQIPFVPCMMAGYLGMLLLF